MKNIFVRSLALLLIALMIALSAVACNDETSTDETDGSDTNGSAQSTDDNGFAEAIVGDEFVIFENGKYNCNIICSDNASDLDKSIYTKIRNRFKYATGVTPAYATDFLAYNDSGESREAPAILIGSTNYEESKQVYSELDYGTGVIKLVGNKLVIAFPSEEAGEDLYIKLIAAFTSKSNERLALDLNAFPVTEVVNASLSALPVFQGKPFQTLDGGDDSYFLRLENINDEDFETYKQIIADDGYALSSTREAGNVLSATFIKDDTYLYTYYKQNTNTLRAIVGPTSQLPAEPTGEEIEQIAEPSLTMVGQAHSDIGLGMVYRLPDGKFVIVDGGAQYSQDLVYEALESQAVTEEITIAAWFLTHAHGDHHGGFIEFLGNHPDVTIENIVFNFASPDMYRVIDGEETNTSMTTIRQKIRHSLPNTRIIKAHTGQVLEFSGVPFEIIYTAEDYYPDNFTYLNDSSLVVRAYYGGKSILMLADATYQAGIIMQDTYGDYLKSDMVQLAHHGIWASAASLYGYIDAEVLLWPSNGAGASSWIDDSIVKAALEPARDIYLPDGSTITISFPYEFIDNKEEFINKYRALAAEGQ